MRTTIKSYNGKINTNFQNNKILKENNSFICQSVISIDSIFRTGKNYLQLFLEECKYVIKEKKIHNYIIDDVEIFSDSDEENYNEDNSDEEFLEKISEEDSSEENSDEKK